MKYIGNHKIIARYIGKQTIIKTYLGLKLIWQAISSCFGAGYWSNQQAWINNEGWHNGLKQ